MIYIPKHFHEQDTARLHALIRAQNFGTLISNGTAGIEVSHLPFLLDGGRNVLRAHMARGNPQWKSLQSGAEVVAVFHGPHHYVSPSWYVNHPSVPTWNYAVVHVTGKPRLIEDSGQLEAMVRDLVDNHEAISPVPWRMDLPVDYREKMLAGIVGFEIDITGLEGKFKLSQNRPAADRPLVADTLEQIGNDNARGIAALMRENASRG
ncbi:MAG TPA: FMN-binding negative transcriptional regulator [Burkholderiales bacterium]|nr:FMN-binding negative transcriptional regulator [Burkholderiales bacterium]